MKEAKKLHRFHPMDAVLILLVIFAVVGVAIRVGIFQKDRNKAYAEYSVEIFAASVDARTAGCLTVGEPLFFENGEEYGVLQAVLRAPHRAVFYQEGKKIETQWPEGTLEDLTLLVQIKGEAAHGGVFRADGSPVLIGQNVRLFSRRAVICGTIRSF